MLPQENKTKKLAKTRTKNNKAFSIIEVLVATGLLSLLSLGIVTLLTEAMKTQRGLQAKDAQREVMAEITQHLGDGAACLNTFSGRNPTTLATVPVSVNAIFNAGPPVTAKYKIGAVDNSKLLGYKKFELVEYDSTQGVVNLAVTLTKLGSVSGVKDIQQKIRLKLNLDASNNITGCSAMGGAASGFWAASAANANNIHYSGGNVGIGVSDPKSTLEVNGSVATKVTSAMCVLPAPAAVCLHVISQDDNIIIGMGTNSAVFRLPDAFGINGRQYTIKNNKTNGSYVALAPKLGSGQTIDGDNGNNYVLVNRYDFVTVVALGGSWHVIAEKRTGVAPGTIGGGCIRGVVWGNAVACGTTWSAKHGHWHAPGKIVCPMGYTDRVIAYSYYNNPSYNGFFVWDSAASFAHGFCIKN